MKLIKLAFLLVVLLMLVLMGVYNRGLVDFNLPPVMNGVVQQPAALMYFAFFAAGVLTGSIVTFGGRKPSGAKPDKQ
jgi:uncharacterized integral membrane protein